MTATTEQMVENMLEEWKRSMLTFWSLGLLLQKPMYGLEIKKEIVSSTSGKMKLGASTIYQLLRRLESRGLITSRWERTEQGPPRAYYELTEAGRELIFRFAHQILSPDSPIAAALGRLATQIFKQSGSTSLE